MQTKKLKKLLCDKGIHASTVSQKARVFILRWSYFYKMGNTSEKCADLISKAFPNSTITEHSDIFKPFRGGASVANSSHFCVKFILDD